MGVKLVALRGRLAALRDDFLVWTGVGLLAVAASQLHIAIAVGLVGLAFILDGLFGGRRR